MRHSSGSRWDSAAPSNSGSLRCWRRCGGDCERAAVDAPESTGPRSATADQGAHNRRACTVRAALNRIGLHRRDFVRHDPNVRRVTPQVPIAIEIDAAVEFSHLSDVALPKRMSDSTGGPPLTTIMAVGAPRARSDREAQYRRLPTGPALAWPRCIPPNGTARELVQAVAAFLGRIS